MAYDIAGSQILAQPVSGFLQGRAMRAAEDQSERKIRALEAAESREAESFEMQKQDRQVKYDEIAGKKALAGAQQVLSVPKGQRKAFVEQNFSDVISGLEQQGYGRWDEIDEDELEELATGIAARASADLGLSPAKVEPLSKEGKVATDVKRGILTKEQGDAALAGTSKEPADVQTYKFAQSQGYQGTYVDFKKELRGKGLSMTLPDGTTISMGESGSQVGPGELAKPTINNLQETIVNSSNRLDRLNLLLSSYKPEYLQARGLLKAGTTELKDFLNMDIPEEDKKFLRGYSEFKASASQEFSATLKELSGTAASEGEVARVMKGLPTDQDKSPEVFEAKARATTKFITRAIMRSNWALKRGIGVKSVEELAKVMPIEGIDAVYNARVNEIYTELTEKNIPNAKEAAYDQADAEFGMAR